MKKVVGMKKERFRSTFESFNMGNTSLVNVEELVSILERLLKRKEKGNVHELPENWHLGFAHANIKLVKRSLVWIWRPG